MRCCLQKKPEEELRKAGAVNEAGCVDIDTGALIFSTAMMDSLYSLIGTEEGMTGMSTGRCVCPCMRISSIR